MRELIMGNVALAFVWGVGQFLQDGNVIALATAGCCGWILRQTWGR